MASRTLRDSLLKVRVSRELRAALERVAGDKNTTASELVRVAAIDLVVAHDSADDRAAA